MRGQEEYQHNSKINVSEFNSCGVHCKVQTCLESTCYLAPVLSASYFMRTMCFVQSREIVSRWSSCYILVDSDLPLFFYCFFLFCFFLFFEVVWFNAPVYLGSSVVEIKNSQLHCCCACGETLLTLC